MFIHIKDQDRYVHIAYDSDNIKERLDNGIYDIEEQMGYFFFKENKAFQKGRVADAGIFKQVRDYVRSYFSDNGKKVRKAMGLQTRLGLFFKGEPGTGKTFMAAKLALELIEKENGIVIYTTKLGYDMTNIVDAIRQKDPDRLVVFILDEFEKDYERMNQSGQDKLLAFLDGGRSRDNVVVIATANSLHGIPSTLLQRPGRFEKVLEFSIKDDFVLTNLVDALIPDDLKEGVDQLRIREYAKVQSNLTIDKLKSIVRDCLVLFLDTGNLFPDDKELLESIDREKLEKESKTANADRKKKPKLNAWERMMRQSMGLDNDNKDEGEAYRDED